MTDLPAPTVSEVLSEYDEWESEREALNRREDTPGVYVDPDEWHNSDDLAVYLLRELARAVRAQQGEAPMFSTITVDDNDRDQCPDKPWAAICADVGVSGVGATRADALRDLADVISDSESGSKPSQALRASVPAGEEVFTVTIVGPEEDDGEAPYLYVVHAETSQGACAVAELAHRADQDPGVEVRRVTVERGLPRAGVRFNDLRGA